MEEDDLWTYQAFDQTNEEEIPSLCNSENEVSLDETVDNEAGTLELSATTMVHHSLHP